MTAFDQGDDTVADTADTAGAPEGTGVPGSGAADRSPVPEGSTAPAGGPAPDETVLGRRFRALTLGIISVVSLIAFEASALNTALPVAAHALDGIALYAYAFSGYFTASLFTMVLSGEWCDRRGPLVPLFTGIAAFGTGLVLAGAAQAMWILVAGRCVQGAGGGLVIVALYVVVGRAYPERLRPAVLASFSAAWVLPVIVGPLVAGTVTEQFGWRWVFLAIPALILLPLAVMLPALRGLPAGDRTPAMDRRRILFALAVAAGAGLLQYAAQAVPSGGVGPAAVAAAAAGLLLVVPTIRRLLPRGTFRAARGLPAVILLRGVAAGSFLGAETFVPLMLVTQRGLTPTQAGLSLTGGGLTWALGSYVQSRSRMEPHRERLMTLGTTLMALSIAGCALALAESVPAWTVAVCWMAGGFGMGLTISNASVLLLELSRPEEAGSNSASLQVSDALGSITLVGLSGVVFVGLGGGSLATGAHAVSGAAGAGAGRPAAFAAVYLAMAAVALIGAYITTRLRPAPERAG
ncbi:MFS transporter [Streptomyces sp. NPDC001922]|uniref:MFS transporter n=1 Tax=Streptomyces sp. NPDC001922 TaxID=3364624 RepID=UPI0036873A6F